MKKIAQSLRVHEEPLINCFRAKGEISAGVAESFSNKAKLAMRKAYGFRTAKDIETALYHQLGTLPEPKFTRKFFRRSIIFTLLRLGVHASMRCFLRIRRQKWRFKTRWGHVLNAAPRNSRGSERCNVRS